MTRLFVSLALVLALAVAAFGAAAALNVNAGNLQAGMAYVGQCDSGGVDVAFTTAFQNGDIYVTGVTVSNIHANCNNRTLTVWLTDSSGNSIATGSTVITGAALTVTVTVDTTPDVKASDVYDVHVLIS
jgi:hypothetical protein